MNRILTFIGAVIISICAFAQPTPISVPYYTDFESGDFKEWSNLEIDRNYPWTFTRFAGRNGNNFISLLLTNLSVGETYTIVFDFYAIDTWDGEPSDYFNVIVNGEQLFHHSFNNFGGAQSYSGTPQQVGNMGFNGYNDSIYRMIAVSFTALSNSATIIFQGQGLEDINNESWGIDNVAVYKSGTSAYIGATSLPLNNSTNITAIDSFFISGNKPFHANSSTNSVNFELRNAGSNGTFGDSDDTLYSVTAKLLDQRRIRIEISPSPLQPGYYKFQTKNTLLDANSNPVTIFETKFAIVNPINGIIENALNNDGPNFATVINTSETPIGSGFLTAVGHGSFISVADIDYWAFSAQAGDNLTVWIDTIPFSSTSSIYMELQDSLNQSITGTSGNLGEAAIKNFTIPQSGNYYVKASSPIGECIYFLRVDLARNNTLLEVESNDNRNQANQLSFTLSTQNYSTKVAGALTRLDSSGDYYHLGNLNVGNSISINARFPSGTYLGTNELILVIENKNGVQSEVSYTGNMFYVVIEDNDYYLKVSTANLGYRSQYLLDIIINDTTPPKITSISLPEMWETASGLIYDIQIDFSEKISANQLTNLSNYSLVSTNGATYGLEINNWGSGQSVTLRIANGPLKPSDYTFVVSSNIVDLAGNRMETNFVRHFKVPELQNSGNEIEDNNTIFSATPLGVVTNVSDGSFRVGGAYSVGYRPHSIVATYINNDTNLDIVTANSNSGDISVLFGNGDGSFSQAVNYGVGNVPVALAVGDLNGDGVTDVVSANYYSFTISVLMGVGDGSFSNSISYDVGWYPYWVELVDVNGDGIKDVITANISGNSVSVWYGAGDGSFTNRIDYNAANGSHGVGCGDFNGDGKIDLAVAGYYGQEVVILFNDGAGGFVYGNRINVGGSCRFVRVGDMNLDGKLDIAALDVSAWVVRIYYGDGNGGFNVGEVVGSGLYDAYQFALEDVNGDGRLDVIVPRYTYDAVSVMLGRQGGGFEDKSDYYLDNDPDVIAVAVGDFNSDGIKDIATANYYRNNISILFGNKMLIPYSKPFDKFSTTLVRGNLTDSTDVDYWVFSGLSGDSILISAENINSPFYSGLLYIIYGPTGNELQYYYTDWRGIGQFAFTLPSSGRYYIRVSSYYGYWGEYRFSLIKTSSNIQIEKENNNDITSANVLTNKIIGNKVFENIVGISHINDSNGDYFRIGSLSYGTAINLYLLQADNSRFPAILELYNENGVLVTNSSFTGTNLYYNIPQGGDSTYYARVISGQNGYNNNYRYGLNINGNNAVVSDNSALDFGTNDFSIETWIYVPVLSLDNNSSYIILSKSYYNYNTPGWALELNTTGNTHPLFRVNFYNTGQSFVGKTDCLSGTLNPGFWYHIAVVRSNCNSYLYINGNNVNTIFDTECGLNVDNDSVLRIGRGNWGAGFYGIMAETRLWNKSLSQTEIESNMFVSLTGMEENLVAYYPMNQSDGVTVNDVSANNLHANFNGALQWNMLSPSNFISRGISAIYELRLEISDLASPYIVGDTLPKDNGITTDIIDKFTVYFSEDMNPMTITNNFNYILNSAGNDMIFETSDDKYYHLSVGYLSGLSANYFITNGPLECGFYKFIISSNIADIANNITGTNYVKFFSVTGIPGFINENRANNSSILATSLSSYKGNRNDGSFSIGKYCPTEDAPNCVVSGKLNTDNYDDIVAIHQSGNVSVLLCNGDGTFNLRTNYYFGALPYSAVMKDFNNDGKNDVAVINHNQSLLYILIGNGDGTFNVYSTNSTGSGPIDIKSADLNNDHIADLALANYWSGNITLFTGTGGGGFINIGNVDSGSGTICILLDDINNDGKVDLISVNYSLNNIAIRIGNGDGSFGEPSFITVSELPIYASIKDFDHDGKSDIAVVCLAQGVVETYKGNGDGTFGRRKSYSPGICNAYFLRAHDLNSDGFEDIIIQKDYGCGLTLMFNNGNGEFDSILTYDINGRSVDTGNFNGDGAIDIAIADFANDKIRVLLGNQPELLAEDTNGTGIRNGFGRGKLSDSSDVDYWSFYANAGDKINFAIEIPGHPQASSLRLCIEAPNGSEVYTYWSDYYGYGQISQFIAPTYGRYTLRVSPNYNYYGEYRIRVSVVPKEIQIENENNNNIYEANKIELTPNPQRLYGKMYGYIGEYESSDFFMLSRVEQGALINLNWVALMTNNTAFAVELYDQNGVMLTSSERFGKTNLSFLTSNANGDYFIKIFYSFGAGAVEFNGNSGYSLRFDGSDDWVQFNRALIPSSGDFTVEAWVYGEDSNNYRTFISQGSYWNAFYIGYNENKKIRVGDSWLSSADFPLNKWIHIAVVKSNANTYLYTNGILADVKGGEIPNPDSSELRIARQYGGYEEFWLGNVDEVRIWNIARSGDDIARTMTNYLAGNEDGLIGYLRFNEGTGTQIADSSPSSANGTILNGALWVGTAPSNGLPRGIRCQYLLTAEIIKTNAPMLTYATVPSGGISTTAVVDRITLSFDSELDKNLGVLSKVRMFNGHNYLLIDTSLNWVNAEYVAQNMGGHLVTINSEEENEFIKSQFAYSSSVWIGLTDEHREGDFRWVSGESVTYTKWNPGEPNDSGNEDYAQILSSGFWNDLPYSLSLYGVIEIYGNDSDGDGFYDSIDPLPFDPYNGFRIQSAGPDNLFDTSDDEFYRILQVSYNNGTNLTLIIADGPLQPGNYRLTSSSLIKDKYLNPIAPFSRFFVATNIDGYIIENRTNNVKETATPITFTDSLAGLKSGFCRGTLLDLGDIDYWKFEAESGQSVIIYAENPGNPSGSSLLLSIERENGESLATFTSENNGLGQSPVLIVPESGVYYVKISQYSSYNGEYRIKVIITNPSLQLEQESNDNFSFANNIVFQTNNDKYYGSVVGYIRTANDIDWYNIGTISNGYTIFVSTRQPSYSKIFPIVGVYNAAGVLLAESGQGRPNDGVAEVPITQTGNYYVKINSLTGDAGLQQEYVIDIQIAPAGSFNYANLIVKQVTPPTTSALSGKMFTFSYQVSNVGNAATEATSWYDRIVLSRNQIYGDADDILLTLIPHTGALNNGMTYNVTNNVVMPDGISGDYYLIVYADAFNYVNEYMLEADNILTSENTFVVELAPYPDIVVENLLAIAPTAGTVYSIQWLTANRGNGVATGGFKERVIIKNNTSGNIILNMERTITNDIQPGGTISNNLPVAVNEAGIFTVNIVTDSRNEIYEYNQFGHISAEQNLFTTSFSITQNYSVTISVNPPEAGFATGDGTYISGTSVTVTAIANTNVMPYRFINWLENGAFQSANSNYTFTIVRSRNLVANFGLPSYQITAANNPSVGGYVYGQGIYVYGSTNILTAAPATGYLFTHWSQDGVKIGDSVQLTVVVKSNMHVVANYKEANPTHYVTTATMPGNITVISGSGTYSNGQTALISAPLSVTNPPYLYRFKEFRLNGVFLHNSNSFTKSFSTVDPSNINYVAYYDASSILPVITNVFISHQPPVPATTNFTLTLQFDRTMNGNVPASILITNPASISQAIFTSIGWWTNRILPNDTFVMPVIVFAGNNIGTNYVYVSNALDTNNLTIEPTNIISFLVDTMPPLNPVISVYSSNSSSVTVSWTDYMAPSDLSGFRVYISTNVSNLTSGNPLNWLSSWTRYYTFNNLLLDTDYYVAIIAVDQAGNWTNYPAPLHIKLTSMLPPIVDITATSIGSDAVMLSWYNYPASELIGFSGFRIYFETNSFNSVTLLSPKISLGINERSATISNLNRQATYYFAVVGYNSKGEFNPNVNSVIWRDPYSGVITNNMVLGQSGQSTIIYRSIIITNGARVTIPAKSTLRFAPGTKIVVRQGALTAVGSALDPIIFTSINDTNGGGAKPGDWDGIELMSADSGSELQHVFIKYGGGLIINGSSPALYALTMLYNAPDGLEVSGLSTIMISDALIANNQIGILAKNGAKLTITNSVIKNNLTNAINTDAMEFIATRNWWGSSYIGEITNAVFGNIDISNFLQGEPLLTPAFRVLGSLTQVGSRTINLEVACRTAEFMRFSENSIFPLTPFQPFNNIVQFTLSEGGGEKTIYGQFRSISGVTNSPINITLRYITEGPVITSFNLTEGMILRRPLVVNGTAYAILGLSAIEFYMDGNLQGSSTEGNYSQRFDVRNIQNGIHRVKLLARDKFGNIATLERNVVVSVEPPSAPVILEPQSGLVITSNRITFTGIAEPLVGISLKRGGATLGLVQSGQDGRFVFTNVALIEGRNEIVATAFDEIGSASAVPCVVIVDSGPPAPVVMSEPFYNQRDGLYLSWRYQTTGERATRFRVLWHTNQFTTLSEALGQSPILTKMDYTLKNIPDGNYYFGVIGYDEAGNESTLSALVNFVYDSTPPQFTIGYDKSSPVGLGKVKVTITSSETLRAIPNLIIKFSGSDYISFPLAPDAGINTYSGELNVTPITKSGTAEFRVSGIDLAGNVYEGVPQGPTLTIDINPPVGRVVCAPQSPIQVTNIVNVSVNLILSEQQKGGTSPVLKFKPPVGTNITIELSGSGTNWNGILQLEPSMGSGFGSFTMQAKDELNNAGQYIESGAFLEIYNTEFPTPPSAPTGLITESKPGGYIELRWNIATNAELYRIYSEVGSNTVAPTTIIADGIKTNCFVDLPPSDGAYRYVVTASRRGAESQPSSIRIAVSDRTPPPAPTNVTAQVTARGVIINWEKGSGETPAGFKVYRNSDVIASTTVPAEIIDQPPRGVHAYTISAFDSIGNEVLSDAVEIVQTVGAVDKFEVLVETGNNPKLTWEFSDPTVAGVNIYRNGIKQNVQPITAKTYTDPFAIGNRTVTYEVRALNSTNAEGPPRNAIVYPISVNYILGREQTNSVLVTKYFDEFRLAITNNALDQQIQLKGVEIQRVLGLKDSYTKVINLPVSIKTNSGIERFVVFPSANEAVAQSFMVKIKQTVSDETTSVIYQNVYNFNQYKPSKTGIEISANDPPVSGSYASFDIKIYNRSSVSIDVVLAKNQGTAPGDIYVSVKNTLGQEVNRVQFQGMPAGVMMSSDGRAFLRISPDSYRQITFSNILVPVSLGTNAAYVEAVIERFFNKIATSDEVVSGPLTGSFICALVDSPYYGTTITDRQIYSDNDKVIITGQSIDRSTSQPIPNVPLKLGFLVQGYRFYKDVTTDENGNYQYIYEPQRGLSGSIKIWAAHPNVYDILNQTEIKLYRFFATPQQFDIHMSKNGALNFMVTLVNPGDEPMHNFSYEFQGFIMEGTNRVPINTITGTVTIPEGFVLEGQGRKGLEVNLGANIDAPDSAFIEFTIRSGGGASARIVGSVTLLEPVPILAIVEPSTGFIELSVNRGDIKSRMVTVVNRGMNDLKGVYIIPPTNTGWIKVNIPISQDGLIHLPDIPVGGSNSFVVVFSPPEQTILNYYSDPIIIGGTNTTGTFTVNAFALVTSSKSGNVRFFVDNILAYPVPNSTVRIKNLILNQELTGTTDVNGYVTITNLQEGEWTYLITAPGHSPKTGTVTIEPDQTQFVSVRLSRNLVTVNFTVEPVPFTDKYEIKIEQTFETHVPVPVMVVTPPMVKYENVPSGFESTIIAIVKNAGLLQLNNVVIEGADLPNARLVPLITYIPVLLPQEEVEVPLQAIYIGGTNETKMSNKLGGRLSGAQPRFDAAGFADCATGGLVGLAEFVRDLATIAARFDGEGQCADLRGALQVAAAVVVIYSLFCSPGFSPLGFLPSPCPSIPYPISFVINLVSCVGQQLMGPGPGGSGGGGYASGSGYGVYNPVCFVEKTSVLMADGSSKPIEMVKINDWVRTGYSEKDRAQVRLVTERQSDDLYQIDFAREPYGETNRVIATGDHAFWVDGKGWTIARQLNIGDWLMQPDGSHTIIKDISKNNQTQKVYSLVLKEDQAFFANSVLVRDRCGLATDELIRAFLSNGDKRR